MTLPAFVAARRTGQTDIRQLHRPIYHIISYHTSVNRPYLFNDWHRFIEKPHTHIRLTALFPGLPRWAGTRKVKPTWILVKQETVSGSGISWAICKSAPRCGQITTPAPHHSVFYRPDALPAAQQTAPKHWRQQLKYDMKKNLYLCTVQRYFVFPCCLCYRLW